MSKKKKCFSVEETKYYEQRFKRQSFKQPINEQRYEWVDLTFYMMDHYQFRSLSPYSTKLYLYMRQWAYKNKEWGKTGVFAYSQTMAHSIGIMSVAQTKRCLAELWEKGFIDKAGYDEHRTALWKFSNRWYTGERQTL